MLKGKLEVKNPTTIHSTLRCHLFLLSVLWLIVLVFLPTDVPVIIPIS